MFAILIGLLALPLIAAYTAVIQMLPNAKKYSVEPDAEEQAHPLSRWYDPNARLDEQAMSALRPFGSAQALTWDERLCLSEPDSPGGDGFHVFADKSGYARVQCFLPGLSPQMVDWWYAWVGYEPLRHKIWLPGRHVQALYGADVPPNSYSLRDLYGKTLYSIERIGRKTPLQKLRYLIVNPADWGLQSDLDNLDYYVCQQVKNGPLKLGRLILRFSPTPDGCLATAHIWLGKELPRPVRGWLADPQNLYDWSYHTRLELERLALLVPPLYQAVQAGIPLTELEPPASQPDQQPQAEQLSEKPDYSSVV